MKIGNISPPFRAKRIQSIFPFFFSVVTGLRFVKKNRIIHLQIQEGKLLPKGKIDVDTVHWVPPEEYKISDRKIFNGQDYHTLSWEKRAIDLDDLEADEGYIVTGTFGR